MLPAQYDAIARFELTNWWYVARRHLLEQTLRRQGPFARGLDLGCGVGSNLPVLARHCEEVLGIDASADAVGWCRRSERGPVQLGDLQGLELPDDSADLVVCTDVLEHLDDDRRGVQELRRVLRPGGLAVITVPAHDYLWNENDDLSEHRRRYTRESFRDLLEGLTVLELSYWNATLLLPALAYCMTRRLTGPGEAKNNLERVPRRANRALTWALRLENRVRRVVPTPVGTSLFAECRVPS